MDMSTSTSDEHLSGYQQRDWNIVDYQMYQDARTGLSFRGPKPNVEAGQYATCFGAAQTLGCFCEHPFPALLQSSLGLEFVNFGYGGAGPRFYLRHPELIEIANRGRFAIVQVMSGRSEDNQLFQSNGLEYLVDRASGEQLSADEAYRRLLERHRIKGLPGNIGRAVRVFHAPKDVREVLSETRRNWVESYLELFSKLHVPIILLWFSKRSPGLNRSGKVAWWWQRYDNVHAMFGKFPQLINGQLMRQVSGKADHYVECISSRGSPQPLVDRFTGKLTTIDTSDDRPDFKDVWTHNAYYPSPEMHEDAARCLEPICRKLLA
ncbi:MAG: DUF6473 family protein [Pseudomonadota bacterium]